MVVDVVVVIDVFALFALFAPLTSTSISLNDNHQTTTMIFPPARMRLPRTLPRLNLARPQKRTLIPPPTQNSGPLLERRSDRALPSASQTNRGWMRTFPIFVVVVGAAMAGMFNYQKSSSSVVSSTLYALRTSSVAREILGEQIYFASKMPWISGEMNQLHGRIDISFWVRGSKGSGRMRFRSVRPDRMSYVSFLFFSYGLTC